MERENWLEIKRAFNEIVELSGEERNLALAQIVDQSVREAVGRLLSADDTSRFEQPVANIAGLWPDETTPDIIGTHIGGFLIQREIGRGGMGVVYEAVRETGDFRQRVALKLLKRGMDSAMMLRRFSRERQILASLDHPNIARLVDGGVTGDGLPFFAMEFVDGVPLDEFCLGHQLDITTRLQLFTEICAAVQFAHSRLVIHRDLKPGNILVTADGKVKLLDFGIAKLISPDNDGQAQTVTAHAMMTPAYASPEQIRGELVSTASDIYSLGLILFEMLTNVAAFSFPSNRPDEMARIICEEEAPRPSSVVGVSPTSSSNRTDNTPATATFSSKVTNPRLLRGDLDNIVLRALQKDPARRYTSVEQFSSDIARHLSGLPVLARPDTLSYRLGKFLVRNRLPVVATAAVIVTLIIGIVATTSQAIRAEREKTLAEERFRQVREIANNIAFKYYDEASRLPNSTALRAMFIGDSLNYLDSLARDPRADESLRSELGRAYLRIARVQGRPFSPNLGDSSGAVENYRKGLAILQSIAAVDPQRAEELISGYADLAASLRQRGLDNEANQAIAESVVLGVKFSADFPDNKQIPYKLSAAYLFRGAGEPVGLATGENIASFRQARAGFEELLAEAPNDLRYNSFLNGTDESTALALLALTEMASDAETLKADALKLLADNFVRGSRMAALYPDEILAVALRDAAQAQYGAALIENGDLSRAEELLRRVEEVYRARLAGDSVAVGQKIELAAVRASLGKLFGRTNRVRESEAAFAEALELVAKIVVQDPQNLEFARLMADFRMTHADELKRRGEVASARDEYRKAVAELKLQAASHNPSYLVSLDGLLAEKLADCDFRENERGRAVEQYERAAAIYEEHGARLINGSKINGRADFLRRRIAAIRKGHRNIPE